MSIFHEILKEKYKKKSLSPSPLIKQYLKNFPTQKIKIEKNCFSPKNPQNKNFIYSLIDDVSGLKKKKNNKKLYKGKLVERKGSIFHFSNEKQDKPLKSLNGYKFLQKTMSSKFSIPNLKRRDKLNNYFIRDYKSENDPNYVNYITQKENLNDKYDEYHKKFLEISSHKMQNQFEKLKNHKILDNAFITNEYELYIKSNDSKRSRNKKFNIDKFYSSSENLYKNAKSKYKKKINERIKEQGKVLSQQLLNLEKDNVVDMKKFSKTIEKDNNNFPFEGQKMPKLIADNLIHNINIKRVIKDSKNIYRVINEDENDLGMDNMDLLKEERRIMQYNYVRTIGHKKFPKFIKSKVSNNTERKFHSLSGNFFGVAC
jgi:hypothetical protein